MDAEEHFLKEIFCIGGIVCLVVWIGSEQWAVALHEYFECALFAGQNLLNEDMVFHERILGPSYAVTSSVYTVRAKVGATPAPIRSLDILA